MSRPDFEPDTFEYTMEMAKTAGLLAQGGNWQKYPAAMLRARCITAAARAYAPDVLDGCYDPDELAPEVQGQAVVTQAPPPPKPPPTAAEAYEASAQDTAKRQTRTEKVKAAISLQAPTPPAPPPPPVDREPGSDDGEDAPPPFDETHIGAMCAELDKATSIESPGGVYAIMSKWSVEANSNPEIKAKAGEMIAKLPAKLAKK